MTTTHVPTFWQTWEETIPAEDREVYAQAGFGTTTPFGSRPCLIVVDVVESFLGPRPGTPASDADFMACGPYGWDRLPNIVRLTDAARAAAVPVVFTKGDLTAKRFCGGSVKATAAPERSIAIHTTDFPRELQPRADEYVLEKARPSAFFGTPLVTYLHRMSIDTIVVAGTTTSGCIRSTVIDSAAHGFTTFVVEDACFDRSAFSHTVNTFEMHQKYAEVVDVHQAVDLFSTHPRTATA
jgi:maleamate amidohydrolase